MDWRNASIEEMVETLTTCDLDVPEGLPEELVRRGADAVVPLCSLFSEAWMAEQYETEGSIWGHIHALHLVGAIGDARAVPALIDLLRRDCDCDGDILGDWLTEVAAAIIAHLSPEAIAPFEEMVEDASLDVFYRFEPARGIFGIACRLPEHRPAVADFLFRMVRESDDEEFVSFIVSLLPQVDHPESRSVFDEAFAKGKVNKQIVGPDSFDEIREMDGVWRDKWLEYDPMAYFSAESLAELKEFAASNEDWDGKGLPIEDDFDEDFEDEDFFVPQKPVRVVKIGRNDPCPCGSGKKYKKCCMGTPNDPALKPVAEPEVLAPAPQEMYQLKVTLLGSEPPIWRRILVPDNLDLDALHIVLQETMGWSFSHLYQFQIGRKRYSDPEFELGGARDAGRAWLCQVLRPGQRMINEYDFGDSWEHEVMVEKASAYDPQKGEPRCLEGVRACPPEDCGGIWGYAELLEIMQNPDHEDYEERMEWLGEDFDPEAFDLAHVNQRLKAFAREFLD